MPYFCIFDHPQLPLTRVSVEKRRQDSDKSGFRLRYVLRISDGLVKHADDVIETIDKALGKRCKAHGIYQAKYVEVRAAYDALLAAAPPAPPPPISDWDEFAKPLAILLAIVLGMTMCCVVPLLTIAWFAIVAFRKRSPLMAMAETAVFFYIFDWRPTINRLFTYGIS